jgi:hypothetical protein
MRKRQSIQTRLQHAGFLLLLLGIFMGGSSFAQNSESPFIDSIRPSLEEKSPSSGSQNGKSFIDDVKRDLPPQQNTGSFIEQVKKTKEFSSDSAGSTDNDDQGEPFIDSQRSRLMPSEQVEVINDTLAGNPPKVRLLTTGEPQFFFTLRVPAWIKRKFSSTNEERSFFSMYKDVYIPDITIIGDYQLTRDRSIWSLGVFGLSGYSWYQGMGKFDYPASLSGVTFTDSMVNFRFGLLTIAAGLSARLFALKYIVPYVSVGPAVFLYAETRDDSMRQSCQFKFVTGACGINKGYSATAGVSVPMDWLSKKDAAHRYHDIGIYHAYLDIQYGLLATLPSNSGNVSIRTEGVYGAAVFEF